MKQDRGKLDDTLAAMFSNPKYRENYLFYAHMIGQCSIKIRDTLPAPAGVAYVVDHYNLYINPVEFDVFSLVERLAILKHEMLHILLGHVKGDRGKGLKHLIWNFGTDCALNQDIDREHLPDVAVLPETLEKELNIKVPLKRSAEEYYNLLLEKMKNNQSLNIQAGDGDGESMQMDSHEVWEESKGDGELQEDITKKMIEKSQNETIKSKGTVPSQCSDWIEMHTRKSEVNWKKILRGILGNKRVGKRSTIMRNDRRFPKREDLRGKTKDRMFNLLVIVDVSGSMGAKAITSTLTEVKNICDITKTDVDLIQVDTEAYEPQKLSKNTTKFNRQGNGGTYLYPAIEKANEHKIDFQAVIILTDGGVFDEDIQRFHNLNKKIIWLVEAGGYISDDMNTGKMKACQLKAA